MIISIGNLWAVAYINNLTGKINIHSKLFDKEEEAQTLAKELGGVVQPVHYSTK
jgi:hypothetical protein